ncbi:hypothetical protein [Halpernia sp. GG3]
MFKPLFSRIFSLLLFFHIMGKAQVDVVYHDLVWSDDFSTNGPVDATEMVSPDVVAWRKRRTI